MTGKVKTSIAVLLISALWTAAAYSWDGSEPLIVDHTCTDLSSIPMGWIDSVQSFRIWHYGHTSHGSQLLHGLDAIETADPDYYAVYEKSTLPVVPGAFCIFQGNEDRTYVEPQHYWESEAGMNATRSVLRNNPTINVSAFAWCTQLSSATEAYVQAYLDSMTKLEDEFPNVTFVYMTGNAQSYGAAPNRYARNTQIRQYCIENNKVLFDFADLDCWWFNPDTEEWEMGTYTDYYDNVWPVQHTQFDGTEVAHTTWESCEQKGKAVWWLMAKLQGWEDGPTPTKVGSWGQLKQLFR